MQFSDRTRQPRLRSQAEDLVLTLDVDGKRRCELEPLVRPRDEQPGVRTHGGKRQNSGNTKVQC